MSRRALVSRGHGPWKEEWYSICSAHRFGGPDDPCPRCRAGKWVNVWWHAMGSVVYRLFLRLWRWWVNR